MPQQIQSTVNSDNAFQHSLTTMTSADLFGTSKLIIIRHAGEEYRLSITSKDKLILTK